jgi:hypothetical protein
MSKYTAGQWEVIMNHYVISKHDAITVCHTGGATQEEAEANARLIAAAPDMLKALEAVQAQSWNWLALVDSAIAKAYDYAPDDEDDGE